ncbi:MULTISPECIES: NO-inducible flavohemoprotein [unclassified Bacillus (in: firmicutes)]|uniref:NO-inducible flavohemoprotein n=1 Tax=unclassified Bacillus (in: firmicutes) TaxID=185979 RepID=UPI001BE92579|nr:MULTISPECIES: NO-inducible flavohemoprotein [unclassified Bacillus (in: firmicutes)]MBT2640386.1 NO-inducible flavohemoprotein [Bacillus sp. ISL-39]MBT2662280.1 NO-inducible flavohemoprotein [Bacillus sp. ISL-45]
MLDQKTIEIIKSTVPVLEVHGEQITTVFYKTMFENHPELLNIFNHANQKQGRQQRALAGTVYAAAKYIDNLEAILPVVNQIAHKHRSLGILPEHYPIVGKHLLMAIKEVLGDAATDEIINAWAAAYGVIADAFISVEAEMYDEAATQKGGWKDFRPFIVAKKVEESEVITSFYLKPVDGKEIASFKPGQYISIKLEIEGEDFTHIRQYSLSDAPGKDYYRISVKKEAGMETPDGKVSNYLHNTVEEGEVLQISAPAGDFFLDTEKDTPVVLLSGGVGLTPMVSMLNTVADLQPEKEVTFIHAAQNGKVHALKDEVAATAAKAKVNSVVFYDQPTEEDRENKSFDVEGYITKEWLKENVDLAQSDFYFCGPVPFMKAINAALKDLDVTEDRIHFEFFGPMASLEA